MRPAYLNGSSTEPASHNDAWLALVRRTGWLFLGASVLLIALEYLGDRARIERSGTGRTFFLGVAAGRCPDRH